MSDTPRTDKFYEEVWRFTNETDAVDALISMRDLCRELERENAALKQRIIDDNKAYGCELRDPSGTIWDHAKRLQDENAALRTVLKRWLKVADDCHLEQQEVGYSEYNITAGLMVDTRALLDAARKETQP